MEYYGQDLEQIVGESHRLHALHRKDLHLGDLIYVKTCNSLYCIRVEEERCVKVSGGWFDRCGGTPVRTTIAGCTWGGSVIKADVVAAIGLSLEFGNRVVTSAIRAFALIPREKNN